MPLVVRQHGFQEPLDDRTHRDPEGAEAGEQHTLEGVAVPQLDESSDQLCGAVEDEPTASTTGATSAEMAFTLTKLIMSVTTANANNESGPALPQPEAVTR